MIEDYKEGRVSLAAGTMMLKWEILNQHVHYHSLHIRPGDKVNVFINLESVLRNLSLQKGLGNMIVFHKQKLVIEIESSILNLMAMYRSYFKKEQCDVNIYFYFTDLNENHQQMECYNKYYRSFYHNKYMTNPQFKSMGELLNSTIIPEIGLILLYVPQGYLLKSERFDGSLIPLIVSGFSDRKNIIISGDIFDTLYMFNPNFLTIYIKRRYQYFNVVSDIDSAVQSIVKNESPFDLGIFRSEMYYRLLLAIKGSKIRNIRSAKGFGYGKFMNILKDGIDRGIILKDFESLDSIIQLFPEQYRESIKEAFRCTDLESQYDLLTDPDIEGIRNQIIDKSDMASLEALNNRRFLEFPINLPGLIG